MPAIINNVFSELVYKQREAEMTGYFPLLQALMHTGESISKFTAATDTSFNNTVHTLDCSKHFTHDTSFVQKKGQSLL